MLEFIYKGIFIGVCSALPIGPVALLAIDYSIVVGRRSGWLTGLGGTVVDTTFAVFAMLILGTFQRLLDDHGSIIQLAGGLIITAMGLSIALKKGAAASGNGTPSPTLALSGNGMVKSMVMGFSNLAAVLVMFALFTLFSVDTSAMGAPEVVVMTLSIFCGSAAYWFLFATVANKFRNWITHDKILWVNKIAGAGIVIFGLVLIIKGAF